MRQNDKCDRRGTSLSLALCLSLSRSPRAALPRLQEYSDHCSGHLIINDTDVSEIRYILPTRVDAINTHYVWFHSVIITETLVAASTEALLCCCSLLSCLSLAPVLSRYSFSLQAPVSLKSLPSPCLMWCLSISLFKGVANGLLIVYCMFC